MWGSAQGEGQEGPERSCRVQAAGQAVGGQARKRAGGEGQGQKIWEVEPPGSTTPVWGSQEPRNRVLGPSFSIGYLCGSSAL